MTRTEIGRRKFRFSTATFTGALVIVSMAGGLGVSWLECRAPELLWEVRSGDSAQRNAHIALVPDRNGDGASEIAAVFATYPGSALVDGSCAIYSGASGVELSKRSIHQLEPDRIVWISADVIADSLLCAWFESDARARNGFVARLVLDTGVRTQLVAFEALGACAEAALVRFNESSLAVVDHTASSQSGRLRLLDLHDGRLKSSRTGDELGFAFDGVRAASTDSGRVDWLALSHRGNRLTTLDAEFKIRASWSVADLCDALLVTDLDADGMPDVVAALIEEESSESLCAFSGASGAVLWKEPHNDIFTSWGASMDAVVAPHGAAPWVAVSGPSTFLDSRHDDAGRIDVFDLRHPQRQRIVPSSEAYDFLGHQVLWASAASHPSARTLYAAANDFESSQAVILAYEIELP